LLIPELVIGEAYEVTYSEDQGEGVFEPKVGYIDRGTIVVVRTNTEDAVRFMWDCPSVSLPKLPNTLCSRESGTEFSLSIRRV
jgi:hypothetical protein